MTRDFTPALHLAERQASMLLAGLGPTTLIPSPVPAELVDIPEKPHAAAHAKPAALHLVPRQSLLSRIWNWVPGGRVAHGDFDLHSLFSSRRR